MNTSRDVGKGLGKPRYVKNLHGLLFDMYDNRVFYSTVIWCEVLVQGIRVSMPSVFQYFKDLKFGLLNTKYEGNSD